MKIAFVQFIYYEYLGIMYLSSSLKAEGHDTAVFIPSSRDERFIAELMDYRPDVVGFSVMTGSEDWAVSLARQIKERMPAYIVFGGPHPTFFPEIIDCGGIDCVCRGEAERSFVDIVNTLSRGERPLTTPGAWFKADGDVVRNEPGMLEEDLSRIPLPDRTLYRKYAALFGNRANMIAGRGCPYSCTFCFNHRLLDLYRGKGRYVRTRRAEDVIGEIREIMRTRTVSSIYFQDDTFSLNRTWLLKFLRAYADELRIPFSCQIRADTVDEDIVQALSAANCRTVSFGIETGNEHNRSRLLQKHISDQDIVQCAALLKKHRIRFRTYNILGLPGETLADAFQTIRLNRTIRTDYPWCSLYQPLPGTELAEQCRSQGLLRDAEEASQPSFFKGTPLSLANGNEIVNLHKLFFSAVKFPFLERLIRRAVKLPPNRFYDLLFLLGHAWTYYFSELVSFRSLLAVGMLNMRRYLSFRPRPAAHPGRGGGKAP